VTLLFSLFLIGGTADRVVAVVEQYPILESDVDALVNLSLLENPQLKTNRDSMWTQMLDLMVSQKLIFKKGQSDTTIQVDRDEVKRTVKRQLDAIYAQLDTLPKQVEKMEELGLSRSRLSTILSNQVRYQMIVQQILAHQGKMQAYISPKRIRDYYDKNRDSISFVPGYIDLAYLALGVEPSQSALADANRKIAEVMDILSRGGEFKVVASSFSEDYTTRSNGGALGWVKKEDFLPEISAYLFSLPLNKISQPVPAPDGFHLFKVEKKSGDKIYLRHILFKLKTTREDTLRTVRKAQSIRQQIIADKLSFADAAKKYSQDIATRDAGGYLGRVPLPALTPPFDSVALAIDSGQVSEPLVSEAGVYLVYAVDKQDNKHLSFEDMQIPIRNYLASVQQEDWLKDIIDELKEEFYVEKKL